MKTIFYKISNDESGDFWFGDMFNQKPYREWFKIDNVLYEPNGNIRKRTIIEEKQKRIIHNITIVETQDTFSDEGIIRRIAIYISN
jgi:hypothetical protein